MRTRSTDRRDDCAAGRSALLTSCSDSGRVICDYAQDAGTFSGRS